MHYIYLNKWTNILDLKQQRMTPFSSEKMIRRIKQGNSVFQSEMIFISKNIDVKIGKNLLKAFV